MMSLLGCAPEITQVKPSHVARDGLVYVEGKNMDSSISVASLSPLTLKIDSLTFSACGIVTVIFDAGFPNPN